MRFDRTGVRNRPRLPRFQRGKHAHTKFGILQRLPTNSSTPPFATNERFDAIGEPNRIAMIRPTASIQKRLIPLDAGTSTPPLDVEERSLSELRAALEAYARYHLAGLPALFA